MPTAKLLDGRPLSEPTDDGRRLLKRRLRVDLGEYLKPLHRQPNRWGISMSKMGTTIVAVPEGTVYKASIPWLVQPLLGPPDLWAAAGAVHDFHYQQQAPRRAADRAFWIISRSGVGVGKVRGWCGFAGLRIGGWVAYRRHGRKRKTV